MVLSGCRMFLYCCHGFSVVVIGSRKFSMVLVDSQWFSVVLHVGSRRFQCFL